MGIKKDKLSEDQKHEIERLRQFVARNRLDARMNGTKWRAAIDAIQAIDGYKARFRVKCVTDAAEPPLEWDEGFPGNIPLYNSIEWLELDPAGAAPAGGKPGKKRPDFGETLKRGLAGAGIPVAEGGPGIRIIGYARNGGKR
jgi:hypothetical protein